MKKKVLFFIVLAMLLSFVFSGCKEEKVQYISFGAYEQDGDDSNGKEPLEWELLEDKSDCMLVMSRYALDCRAYNDSESDVTWETCSLRQWLNEDFYEEAFNDEEKNKILKAGAVNNDNSEFETPGGNDTSDRIVLLSIDEAEKYCPFNGKGICDATPYADEIALETRPLSYKPDSGTPSFACDWWLRSPGEQSNKAAYISKYGYIIKDGSSVNFYNAVRPVLWIAK